MLKNKFYLILLLSPFLLAACGTAEPAADENTTITEKPGSVVCVAGDDDCWWEQSEKTLDKSFCQYLSSTSKEEKCFSYIQRLAYEKENLFDKCGNLKDLTEQDLCYMNILEANGNAFCDEVQQKQLCKDYFAWQAAQKMEDCDIINRKDWQRECLSTFGDTAAHYAGLDLDNDGLSNEKEAQYGTDPKKADTDGDGYSDGEEVEAGFDPLKK